MKNLPKLKLSGTQIDGHGLELLGQLPNLEELFLSGTNVNDSTVGELTKFTKLRRLWLDGTTVSDDGLMLLTDLHWLDYMAEPTEHIFGKFTPENGAQRRETMRQVAVKFNSVKREKYLKAQAEGLEVPDSFRSPYSEYSTRPVETPVLETN